MPSSLVKFSNRAQSSGGEKLFWERVGGGADNLPFRGQQAPMYTEEEFESKTVRVADVRNAFFDVLDKASNKQYLDVMECIFNGWFQLVHLERFWVGPDGKRTHYHYVEWSEFYLEDGTRTSYVGSGQMELPNGHANLGFNP